MKICSLELEQFRKFEQPVRISGFSDTLNVLCGPNEFGKSTLLAAIRGLLFERHASKADAIKKMQPWRGDAAPRLAMEFELEDGRWRIEKQFLHRPMARLTGPAGTFDADAAEEELQRLLGFGGAGRRGATADQLGVWGALWVRQRESLDQADLTGELARTSVQSCLDTEVGVMTGSEKGNAILRTARAQLAELQDGRGKPRGRHAEVLEAITELDRQLIDLNSRSERLSADTASLRQATLRLQALNDPEAAERDRAALEDARRRKEAAQLFEQKRAAAEARLGQAQQARDAVAKEHQAREARRKQMAEARSATAASQPAADAARARLAEAEASLQASRQAEAATRVAARDAAEAVQQGRRLLDLVRRAGSLGAMQAALAQADMAQDEVARLAARLDQLHVTGDLITEIRKALRDAENARSALLAQATAIDFELEAGARDKVTLDGTSLPRDRQSVSVVSPAEIAIDGIGRIVVRPIIPNLEKQQAQAAKAAARLEELLTQAACRDADEAERRFTERGEVERALGDARAQLKRFTPGDKKSGLAPGLEALRAHLKLQEHQTEAGLEALGLTELPGLGEAEKLAQEAEDAALEAQDRLTQARADMDAAGQVADAARDALRKAEGDERIAQAELDRLTREDAEAVTREGDEALAARLEAAEQGRADCAHRLAALETERSGDTADAMDVRIQRYEQAQRNRTESIAKLKVDIAELRTRISQEGGAGLDELIESMRRELEVLAKERDALRHEADVLQLLIRTLTDAEKEAKERYLAPVVRRVTPYLRSLFPSADIVCDENLRITGLLRDGSGAQEFDRLSDGTQEQLAVLARLAFAQLLAEQGKPAMVILDDALAYSDGERIERMFDILAQAARHTQILVLTCREDLFARLGGNPLSLSAA